MTRRCLALSLTFAAVLAGPIVFPAASRADDILVFGDRIRIKPGEFVRAQLSGPIVPPGPDDDPTVEGGRLLIFDTAIDGAGGAVFDLPAAGWKALGRPGRSKGFRFSGGTCKRVRVVLGKIDIACGGGGDTLNPPFQGDVAVVLRLGSNTTTYGTQFPPPCEKNSERAVTCSYAGIPDGMPTTEPLVAVLSAFPAELSAVLAKATVEETLVVEGDSFRLGTLGGVRVVLAMTGIGLVNATETTSLLLDRFAVTGVVVSGVAGSPYRIGDVAVPETWTLEGGATYAADSTWLALAEEIAEPGATPLEKCTLRPDVPSSDVVCLPFEPAILVGGRGSSSDPFGGAPFPCRPDIERFPDVFGCDVLSEGNAPAGAPPPAEASLATDAEDPVAGDMESAAIAAEAAARGLPFIVFRAVSDGEGDPLGLPGFPATFFAYYRLAAHNAAAATTAFLERLSASR
jgi:nucleoside phosphorylase